MKNKKRIFPFSSFHFSLLFFVVILLCSCSAESTSPTPYTEEELSIKSVNINGIAVNLSIEPTDVPVYPVLTFVFSINITPNTQIK